MTRRAESWNTLAQWGIPEHILAQAPESPWVLPPQLFTRAADEIRDTPSRRAALEALPENGSVLDVGCGAGAASLALTERKPRITGVDQSEDMLTALRERADADTVLGTWPDVADEVSQHDVVVCHHVVYNVGDIAPFVQALDAHARRRVVLELTAQHPRATLNPLWRSFWNLERPDKPDASDLESVLREEGYVVVVETFDAPSSWSSLDEMVPWIRRWVCLPATRDAEVRAALESYPPPKTRKLVTMWWDVT